MLCLQIPTHVCERFIYFQDRSVYSSAAKSVDRSWEYINRSQTHECGNWGWGRAIPRKGIYKWNCRCNVGDKINSSLGLSNRGPRQTTTLCRSWLYPPSQGSMNSATTLSISVSCTVNIYWKSSLQRRIREETGIYSTVSVKGIFNFTLALIRKVQWYET